LRICTLHFTDDCVVSYAARRILKDWALPTLHLPSIEQDRASTNIISNFETIELQHNPVIIPAPKCKQVNIQTSVQACYRQKLRQIKKVLYKKKIKIYEQRKQINKLRKRNKWEEIVTDFSSVQRIFLDMIKMNLKRKPEVCFS